MTELLSHRADLRLGDLPATLGAVIVTDKEALVGALGARGAVRWHAISARTFRQTLVSPQVETLVYVPGLAAAPDVSPDLDEAREVLAHASDSALTHAILVSSTLAYGACWNHPGLAKERRPILGSGQPIARTWLDLERLAVQTFGERHLTVLRAAPMPTIGGDDYFSRLLSAASASVVSGHDPTLQFLSLRDLADAISRAVERRPAGLFNIVPAAPVALRAAMRASRCRALPTPFALHLAGRRAAALVRRGASINQVQFIRYNLTASGAKAEGDLGFLARDTSLQVASTVRRRGARDASGEQPTNDGRDHDPFGLDASYIEACRRGVMGFMHRRYWRIETAGLDRIPAHGPAVLVGLHRGFMPFDGVMTLLTVSGQNRRIPRFLIHPGLLKFPYLFNLMSKLGGVVACEDNAAHVLGAGELLGIYPEGIRGAFTMYKRAHRVAPSWRDDCIRFAVRHRAPIVPFVTVGSAEIFPILGRIKASRWKQYSDWPFIPITPTFPLLPVPLPSKWHTLFLEPLHVERDHPADAADDPAVVRTISADVRHRMEVAVADIVARRPSIFYGSVFTAASR